MTSWNPLNVFSASLRRIENGPSSAFDPSRTGDPIAPGLDHPAIGFGDTRVGAPSEHGDTHRRPIGFAPSESDWSEPRYHTELSFKRHHEAPRASTVDPQDDTPSPSWPTGQPLDLGAANEAEIDLPASESVEKVPFYKREISFRRKRADSDDVAETVAVADDESNDLVDVSKESVAAELAAPEAVAEETVAVEDVVEEPVQVPVADATASAEVVDVEAAIEEDVVVATADDAPISATDDAPDPASVADEPAATEAAPAPGGRFGSRGQTPEKAPKRNPARRGSKGRRVVGLKIGASQLAAAVVAETDAGHELVELARRPLAPGIVVDGEVRDLDALANALKAFFDEEKLPKKDVRIGLASNRIGVRTFEIAGIDDESRFDNAVRFKAHEVLPVAVHESVLDYRVLEERPNEAGEPSRRVLLVVAPRDQVEPYAEVARRAGIKLAGIDLEALGLLRTFVAPRPYAVRAADDTATVVVAIGHESSTLLVSGGGTCEFTRVFDWGGGALQEAIAAKLDVQPAEAATILRHLSLSGPGRQLDGLDDETRAQALEAVRVRLTPFTRELVSSLQFYQTQPDSLGIGGIMITGGTSHLEGLAESLNQMIGVKVAVGDPLSRVIRATEIEPSLEAMIGSMAVPIGLAIDDISVRSVDLMPRDAEKGRGLRPGFAKILVPVAVAVPLVAIGFVFASSRGTVGDRQSELAAVNSQIAALPVPRGAVLDAGVVGAQAQRATAVANVLGGRVPWESVFRDLSLVLPANVWLEKMSATVAQPGIADAAVAPNPLAPTGPVVGTGVTLSGFTYTQPDVALLLSRLGTVAALKNISLKSSQVQPNQAGKTVVRFEITADLNTTGGA